MACIQITIDKLELSEIIRGFSLEIRDQIPNRVIIDLVHSIDYFLEYLMILS